MRSGQFRSSYIGSFAVSGFILFAAGCQSSDTAGVLNLGGGAAEKRQITQEELLAFCPAVSLREGTAIYYHYAKGGQDDATKLAYQASISDATRACTYNGGMTTINVALAGRVVPGPVAQAGTINMPIRVVVKRGEEILYDQLHKYPVAIAAGAAATQFVFNDPNVTIPTPPDRNIRVFAGFEESPAAKKKKAASDD